MSRPVSLLFLLLWLFSAAPKSHHEVNGRGPENRQWNRIPAPELQAFPLTTATTCWARDSSTSSHRPAPDGIDELVSRPCSLHRFRSRHLRTSRRALKRPLQKACPSLQFAEYCKPSDVHEEHQTSFFSSSCRLSRVFTPSVFAQTCTCFKRFSFPWNPSRLSLQRRGPCSSEGVEQPQLLAPALPQGEIRKLVKFPSLFFAFQPRARQDHNQAIKPSERLSLHLPHRHQTEYRLLP